ncbi:MAG: UDP-N-acetylglucosamine 1-carboxyvinyltransferase [bacterium]
MNPYYATGLLNLMDKFIIQGQKILSGEIEVRGSKNAAGPCLAACLLTDEECEIDNLPLIEDVFNMLEVLKSMGVKVDFTGERKVRIHANNLNVSAMDFKKNSKTRISVLLFGSLMARVGSFKISAPGGDKIGLRPISVHLNALKKLGAEIEKQGDFYKIDCKKLKGSEIVLGEFSVTATETLMMAAVLADGKTVIKGAASEPHVQDLGEMLKKMGAKIKGLSGHTLEIEGVKKLQGVSHSIIFDPIEAATFISMGAVVPGKITVKNVFPEHLDLFLEKIKEIGVNFEIKGNSVTVSYSPELNSVKVQALPYPGFPTDFLPVIVPLLVKARGKSLIHDPLYENRFNYVQQLRKMGADVEIVDPHRAFVFGPSDLYGLTIESWDLRAGACLIIAGMMAKGETAIENIYQIDRGYEKIEERLQGIGADIKRVSG